MSRLTPLAQASGEALSAAFAGKGAPRKSKITVGIQSGEPDPIYWLKRKKLQAQIKSAAYLKRLNNLVAARQARGKRFQQSPCPKRWAEMDPILTAPSTPFTYTTPPRRIMCGIPKFVYELLIAGDPYISFTDSIEALRSCEAMQANGWPSAMIKCRDLRSNFS